MVRFIIRLERLKILEAKKFTFQYGQIYYLFEEYANMDSPIIYIPIWLDLLY